MTSRNGKFILGLILFVSLFLVGGGAHANPVATPASSSSTTYVYVGNRIPSCNCNISGWFTVPQPLTTATSQFFTPTSFSFTDGETTITNTNADLGDSAFEYFTIGANGLPSQWEIQVAKAPYEKPTFFTENLPGENVTDLYIPDYAESNVNNPGTWVIYTSGDDEVTNDLSTTIIHLFKHK